MVCPLAPRSMALVLKGQLYDMMLVMGYGQPLVETYNEFT